MLAVGPSASVLEGEHPLSFPFNTGWAFIRYDKEWRFPSAIIIGGGVCLD